MTGPSVDPPPPPPEAADRGFGEIIENALNLLAAVRSHWWLILLLTVAAGAGTFLNVVRQPAVYMATATILLDTRPVILDKVTDVVTRENVDLDRFVNGQVQILTSRDLADETAKKLGLPAGSLVGTLRVELDKNSPLLRLTIEDPDPARAQEYVNAFADVFVTSTIRDRLRVTTESAKLLDNQARSLRSKLESDERALYVFQRSHELPGSNFDESHKIQSSNLQALNAQFAQARAAGMHLKADLDQLDAAQGDGALLRAIALRDENTRAVELRGQRIALVQQLAQLDARYGQQHPRVIEARKSLATLDSELDREVGANIAALRARTRANASEQAQLKAAIAVEMRKAVDLRESELDYKRLVRQIDEDRAAYDLVSRRQKEAELQGLDRQTYARRLDAAQRPTAPVRPDIRSRTILGALIGLLVACVLAFLLDYLNDVIRTPTDAERSLKQPVVGIATSIPTSSSTPADPAAIEIARAEHVLRFPRSRVAEQFHGVATNLYSLFLEQQPRAIMVISGSMEEGKTLVSVTLAATMAARGKRVLIVDADLRRGRLHRLFCLPKGGGLFELVMQRITTEEAVRQTSIPNVDLITTGAVPNKVSPHRILELKNFGATLEALKERYDLVIIDTPPIGAVSDAQLIGGFVDGAVGVVRAGRTSRRLARGAAALLDLARVNLVGWVINDVPEAALRSGYYYKKYGYDYSRYAYGGPDEDEPPADAA